ncbi:DUF72 domain-containing protein [Eisenibacter elegans]|uniref:DUF72 domain-containing protein n=1 Tax=Eisenibacter elegans TaxID=997 RepID=UPI00040B8DB7|nr:DUF72 domain-containing protein [Eisenibacter elegans]
MDFGKLTNVDNVDFTLPEDHSETAHTWQLTTAQPKPLKIWIGCPIWAQPAWLGQWYPKTTPKTAFLQAYAQQFNTIELNSTHYHLPTFGTLERWVMQTPENFRFYAKVPQELSHRLIWQGQAQTMTEAFIIQISTLGNRLGGVFIQLPPAVGPQELPTLLAWLKSLPKSLPLSVELRQQAWFTTTEPLCTLAQELRAQGRDLVLTDVAGRRDVLHMCLPSPRLILRWVGNAPHPSDAQRIDAWVNRIAQWQQLGLEEAYIFVHQPDNIEAPQWADYWIEQLNQTIGLHLMRPKRYDKQKGQQTSLF